MATTEENILNFKTKLSLYLLPILFHLWFSINSCDHLLTNGYMKTISKWGNRLNIMPFFPASNSDDF